VIRIFSLILLLCFTAVHAAEIHVVVEGVGCHTRQLAVQKIWSALPGVTSVVIRPRGPTGIANQRVFEIISANPPSRQALDTALGARTRFYKIRSISSVELPTPALSVPITPVKVHP
jgi:hypothetical protein